MATRLRVHQVFRRFFPGFPVKSSSGFINFFCSAAKWSNSFTGFIMIILMIDNVYEEYFPHMLVLCVTAGVFLTPRHIRTNCRVKQSFFVK